MWRDPRPGTIGGEPGAEPNNWGSFFSGSAWEWVPERGQYYLHLFSKKQPDLNWESPAVRRAVFDMMNRWLDRGVDGFRMDVINFISKDAALPDGAVLPTGFGDGMPFFVNGPRLQEFLAEMKAEVFDGRPGDYLTVGEMPDATPELAASLTDARTGQLSMIFQFEHVSLDQVGGKWNVGDLDLRDLKRSFGRWQDALAEHGWNSLYWNNHDQPRIVSRWGNDREHWYASATALATVLHLHRGTPYIYQGEELGMTNVPFDDISALRDIESLNHYAAAVTLLGHEPDAVMHALRAMGRDNARTPMQWSAEPGAGFTAGTPWIGVNPNHAQVNAAAQVDDPESVYAFYQRLIALRHADPVVVDGDFRMLLPDDPAVYAFARELDGQPAARRREPLRRPGRVRPGRHGRRRPGAHPHESARSGGIRCPGSVGGARLPIRRGLSAPQRRQPAAHREQGHRVGLVPALPGLQPPEGQEREQRDGLAGEDPRERRAAGIRSGGQDGPRGRRRQDDEGDDQHRPRSRCT